VTTPSLLETASFLDQRREKNAVNVRTLEGIHYRPNARLPNLGPLPKQESLRQTACRASFAPPEYHPKWRMANRISILFCRAQDSGNEVTLRGTDAKKSGQDVNRNTKSPRFLVCASNVPARRYGKTLIQGKTVDPLRVQPSQRRPQQLRAERVSATIGAELEMHQGRRRK